MRDNACGAAHCGNDALTPTLEKTGRYGVDHPGSRQKHHDQGSQQKFITQSAPSSDGDGAFWEALMMARDGIEGPDL